MVSTHLKNLSQIGSCPQGSGWKFQKYLKPPSLGWKKWSNFSWTLFNTVLSKKQKVINSSTPIPPGIFSVNVLMLWFFFSAPIKSRYLLSGFPESARSAPPTRNQRTLSTRIGWQFFLAKVSFHLLVGGFNPSEKYSSNWITSPRFGVNIQNLWNHHLAFLTPWPFHAQNCWPLDHFPASKGPRLSSKIGSNCGF